MEPEESAVAKSTGLQEEKDMSMPDATLFHVLASNKKISKPAKVKRIPLRGRNIDAQSASLIWVTRGAAI